MAGGMRRGRNGTLADRTAATRGEAPTPPPAPPGQPFRHCWVKGADGRLPGLLLGWERRHAGWFGRVVYPRLESGGWVVVEEWLPADQLGPVS